MAIGVKDVSLDYNNEPYKSLKNHRSFVPSAKDLCAEIHHRALVMGYRKLPKPNNWTNFERMEWLENNPIKAQEEINFICREVQQFDTIFRDSVSECVTDEKSKNDVWSGQLPFLQFYHVLMDDRVRIAFLEMHKCKNRAELDGRNSTKRPPDVFKIAVEIYDDRDKDFATFKYPTLHKDFLDHSYLWGKDAIMVNPQNLRKNGSICGVNW
jgi:hypothetical protein